MSPLGETLRRARLAKGITIEDAERVTRIPRKYLEALELENFTILPAPVYARGFLRSYAGYLGLDAAALLPFFPVGHVDEPRLEPLPEVKQPRTWNMSGVIAIAVVGFLIMIVVALYSVGREDSNPAFISGRALDTTSGQNGGTIVPPEGEGGSAEGGPAIALPDFAGGSLQDAVGVIERAGATYIVVEIRGGDVPTGQVVDQAPPPGTAVGAGDLVTITVAR
ncbi:MAG: helix-turn-helix domain-containing protein [Dehalococcoidia bacterium]|nr:helix-turn-helix domain-containing protein [Dehalococcoidia bacterium]